MTDDPLPSILRRSPVRVLNLVYICSVCKGETTRGINLAAQPTGFVASKFILCGKRDCKSLAVLSD